MIKKYIKKFKELDETGKHLFKLNSALFSTIGFIIIYTFHLVYANDTRINDISKNQEILKTIAYLPTNYQIGGFIPTNTNDSNTSLISTNVTFPPIKVNIDKSEYTLQTEYIRGDVVFVKFFNIYGVVVDKSLLSKDYYQIVYRDNIHTLNIIALPFDFLLKPSPKAITPFIFTP